MNGESGAQSAHDFELMESAINGALLRCKRCKKHIVAVTISESCWVELEQKVENRIVNP